MGIYMKTPVGTSWEVPKGVETDVYVDMTLMYDLVDWLGMYLVAALSMDMR